MKKIKKTEKKLSLNKLQMAKINSSMNSIKGGNDIADPDKTIKDKTLKTLQTF